MRIHLRRSLWNAVCLTIAFALPVAAGAGADGPGGAVSPPLVVKIHADWCGTCQMLGPTWERVERELGGQAQVVTLDVTDRAAIARSSATAERLGIGSFFAAYRSQLGTVAVLRAGSREPVEIFNGELDYVAYADAVRRAQ